MNDNVSTVQKPRNRITARRVLDSAPYNIYGFAEDFGLHGSFIATLEGLTNMREAGRRIVMLAARTIADHLGTLSSIRA